MSRHRLSAAVLVATLLVAPAATAVAEELPDASGDAATAEDTTTADVTPTSFLAALLDAIATALVPTPPADEATDTAAPEADGPEIEVLRGFLTTFLDALRLETTVQAALADAAALTDVEEQQEETATQDGEAAGAVPHGQIVRTVAHCAPRGQEARGLLPGIDTHGHLVRLAAHGEDVTATGVDPETGTPISEDFSLSTMEGATAFCDFLALLVRARETAEAEEAAADEELSAAGADRERPERGKGRAGRDGERGKKGTSGEAKGKSGEAKGKSGRASRGGPGGR